MLAPYIIYGIIYKYFDTVRQSTQGDSMTPTSSLSGYGGIKSTFGPAGSRLGKGNISGYKYAQLPTMDPQQQNFYQSLLGGVQPGAQQGVDYLSKLAGGDQSQFEQLEAPYYTALNQAGAQLGSRFSGLGMGAQQSSGFQNALAGQAGELSEKIGSQRMGIQQQAIRELLGLSESLLGQSTFTNFLAPPKQKGPSFWNSLGSGLGQGIGMLPGLFL